MAIIKCKMCGGDLNITEGTTVAECEYCGSVQTVPTVDHEKKLTLFGRANRLRLACEFDKAAGVYESIVAEFPEEAEAYWGLVLCRYGIEYVDDPATGKKTPTCHRSSFDSILEDVDFDQACENADAIARKLYREEAKAIEELRKGILEVSGKEEPYDIFICYKETDEKGDRTIDSVIAQDVYDALTEKGYRVFFSRISLEDKLGTEYEPYIFAALNSAKVMLAFGTDYEYYNAVWVKNEWSRFLALISAGQKKALIPCYKGIDAYDMPKEFQRLQAQDMGKIGAVQDLLRGIDKLFNDTTHTTKEISIEAQLAAQSKTQADNLVHLGIMSLNSGDTEKAIQQFEEAIRVNSNHIGAYIGLVRATTGEKSRPYCKRLESFPAHDVEMWLKESPDMLNDIHSPLLDRIIYNTHSTALVQAALAAGADPDGQYALYYAISSENRIELTKLLLDYGANVNRDYQLSFQNSTEMHSPLVDAVWYQKDLELSKLLIQSGADVNYVIRSSDGVFWTVLDSAVRRNDISLVQLLLENGADPNGERLYKIDGTYTVHYNCLSDAIWDAKSKEIVQLLLKYHANPNYSYKDYYYDPHMVIKFRAALDVSCLADAILYNGDAEIMQILLAAGANPNSVYKSDCIYDDPYDGGSSVPVLYLAFLKKDENLIRLLLEAGASLDEMVSATPRFGTTTKNFPLKYAKLPDYECESIARKYGWKGSSLLKGGEVIIYLK